MIFEIQEAKTVTLVSSTNRSETHGKDQIPAVSYSVLLQTDNFFLDTLMPGLRETLYQRVGGDTQEPISGAEIRTPKLRIDGLGEIPLTALQFNGWTVHVDHGIDEAAPIVFGKCRIDDFRLTPKQDSIIDLRFRIGTSDVDVHRLGLLGMKIKQKISIRAVAPVQEMADSKAVRKAQKKKARAEEAGQQTLDDATPTSGSSSSSEAGKTDTPSATDAFIAANHLGEPLSELAAGGTDDGKDRQSAAVAA